MFVGGKRKFPEDTIQDESNKENRVENGDVSAETGIKKAHVSDEDAKSAAHSKVSLGRNRFHGMLEYTKDHLVKGMNRGVLCKE